MHLTRNKYQRHTLLNFIHKYTQHAYPYTLHRNILIQMREYT